MQFASLIETQHRDRNMSTSPHVPSSVVVLPELIPGATSGDDEDMSHGRDPMGNAELLGHGRSQAVAGIPPKAAPATASWRQTSGASDSGMAREIRMKNYEKAIHMIKTLESQQDH